MSMAEIMQQLPKLTSQERFILSQRLRELDREDGMLFLHEAADTMFADADIEEEKNARRKTR